MWINFYHSRRYKPNCQLGIGQLIVPYASLGDSSPSIVGDPSGEFVRWGDVRREGFECVRMKGRSESRQVSDA
jgi:hypothetical protein